MKTNFCRLDKNGYVINDSNLTLIQKEYKPAINTILTIAKEKLKKNLHSAYVRGSVSKGNGISNISDLDVVLLLKKKIKPSYLRWSVKLSKDLEKEFSFITLVDITILSINELLTKKNFKKLQVYLKTESICLFGTSIYPKLSKVKPGKNLAKFMYREVINELIKLKKQFEQNTKRTYLDREKSTKFWCIWTMRTILRSSLGLVMAKKPIYSQNLKICAEYTKKYFPELKEYIDKALILANKPTSDRKKIIKYLEKFIPIYSKYWKVEKKYE